MLLDAMTRKPKRFSEPLASVRATQSSGGRGERQKFKKKRTEGREDENLWSAEMARNRESVFVTATGIQSHKVCTETRQPPGDI